MILVIGATGFVGSHLLYHLLKTGVTLRATYKNPLSIAKAKNVGVFYSDPYPEFNTNIDWVNVDITDFEAMLSVMKGISRVYNCSGFVSFNPGDKDLMIAVNVLGTRNIVNAALFHGVEKLIHLSSIAALGESLNGQAINEECHWVGGKQESWYSITKFNAEAEVWRASAEGLDMAIVNPSVIIGAGDWSCGSPSIIARLCKPQRFYPMGSTGIVDVRDVCNTMLLLMDSKISNQRFIVNGANVSFRYLCDQIASLCQISRPTHKAHPLFLGLAWRLEALRAFVCNSSPSLTRNTCRTLSKKQSYSSKKIEDLLGFKFTPLDLTLKQAVDHYK